MIHKRRIGIPFRLGSQNRAFSIALLCIAPAITLCPARADLTSTDSAPFPMNTQSTYTAPTFTDSAPFNINTALTTTVPTFADSAAFNLNTSLTFIAPAYSDSQPTSLDTRNINRAWGDSELFSMNVPQAAPTLNSAVPQCNGITPGIRLTWTAAPGATNYDIFRNNALIFTTQTNGITFWNINGLSAGATYTYKIRARFGALTSPLSNPVSAVAPMCALTPPANQPPPGLPPPRPPLSSPSHLWPWNEGSGTFQQATVALTPNPNWPTYILAHGWDGALDGIGVSKPPCQNQAFAMSSIACAIRQRVHQSNIYAWDWAVSADPNEKCDVPDQFLVTAATLWQNLQNLFYQGLFQGGSLALANRSRDAILSAASDLEKIYQDAYKSGKKAKEEGSALTLALKDLIQANNGQIGSELHFIGHSHGGGLLGQTARELSATYPIDSLTALDTPRIAGIDTQELIVPSSVNALAFFYYTLSSPLGVGRAPLKNGGTNVLLHDLPEYACSFVAHTWIHGCDPSCVPENQIPWGWYPLAIPGKIFTTEFDNQPISILDVDQFPTGYFYESNYYKFYMTGAGACCYPYGCEITSSSECNSNSGSFQGPGSNCTACSTARMGTGSTTDPNLAGMGLLLHDALDDAASWQGTNSQLVIGADPTDPANICLVMSEDGEASFFKDIAWPAKVSQLKLDYMFRDPRGDESLTVYLNDEILYYDNASISLAVGQLRSSGAIYVGHAAGTTASLTFVLRTDNTPGGSVVLDNIRIWGFIPGDLSGDGKLDALDIAPFITAILTASTDPGDLYIADFNADNTINPPDLEPFVTALLAAQ
ncbi:MAG: hypothetical protein HZA51_18380 [Planctomycetes bacterium]|nr:hypothetical protein [Planctomycetota bacterium]